MFDKKILELSMQKLKQGDISSFDIIYDQTHKLIYYCIYQILHERTASEDIMQDVYLKIYQKISMYENNTSPRAWITTIAKNLALNELKRRQKEFIINPENIDLIASPHQETPLIDLAAKILPEDEYMILMMCVVERYKRKEVAKIFNLSTSGVTWKLNQALQKLKEEVQHEN